MYTTSTAFLDALQDAGVSIIFANLGSDHPALVESLAEARATGRPVPRLITCPNEMVALSAAHGYAQVSGRAQAVVVHVECGTQALAGAVHNVAKARIPALIFAGASPFTQEGELKGSRNEFIQWIQDVHDQRGLVRGYMKYDNEIRTGRNVRQLVNRAFQLAYSDPKGPVYLMGAREVMEEAVEPTGPLAWTPPLPPAPLPETAVEAIAGRLLAARRPLVVTSYLGRRHEAVAELLRLCDRLAVGVLESVSNYMNFPLTHPMHQGIAWNEPVQNEALAEADYVLVLDSDIPWIPTVNRPNPQATIHHIDVDALKQQMPLWYIPAAGSFQADVATALAQVNGRLDTLPADERLVGERRAHYGARHQRLDGALEALERPTDGGGVTPEYLVSRVRRFVDDNTIVLNEGITNYPVVMKHLRSGRPGGVFTSGGGSLGWNGGAAIGAKLAFPDKTVVALTGDGSYMFSVPSSVHWMARRYETPFVQIVFNNGGWRAPKFSTLAVHPDGYASRADDIGVSFDPPSDYAGIAAASGGALGLTVHAAADLDSALEEAFACVRTSKRAAVLDVQVPHL
ncbi:thiamine pyrophosphate-requiring protein [Azospirillum sp. TSO35-2]|uniref:thiamine pyrophosphate-requiring protein n=1 Tax=Azospirillum sp. TSO35-2 TaxID=716796 RepID=UPI000D6188A8|nr:thiamine pyrophosphate-requiring protein [Azospirillum sp. TSO35-2]PWC36497.1 acetolactate synthase [Azospirillum sp. TSO35-2]